MGGQATALRRRGDDQLSAEIDQVLEFYFQKLEPGSAVLVPAELPDLAPSEPWRSFAAVDRMTCGHWALMMAAERGLSGSPAYPLLAAARERRRVLVARIRESLRGWLPEEIQMTARIMVRDANAMEWREFEECSRGLLLLGEIAEEKALPQLARLRARPSLLLRRIEDVLQRVGRQVYKDGRRAMARLVTRAGEAGTDQAVTALLDTPAEFGTLGRGGARALGELDRQDFTELLGDLLRLTVKPEGQA